MKRSVLEQRFEQLQGLYDLATAANRATDIEEIYAESLRALKRMLGVTRASILLFDGDGVMRFKASVGISDAYRRAVEGHSPWSRDTKDPRPIFVTDVEEEPALGNLREEVLQEGIRSLWFLPLVHEGQLLGKFMVYYETPHRPSTKEELQLAQIIAYHVSSGIGRKLASDERDRLLRLEQSSRKEAEEANRVKDEFLTTLSHELRTPLTTILGWCRLAQEGRLDEGTRGRAIETIARNARLQLRLIEDLLDISRIVARSIRLDLSELDLTSVVEEVVEGLQQEARSKNVLLEAGPERSPQPVVGDATRLSQILWNIIANAVKFTPLGGRVRVVVERRGTDVEVRITDTGRGIGADFLPYVFEAFRREEGGTRRSQTGLGLGLAIAQHLAELHGGRLAVSSPGKGKGSTFLLRLPLSTEVAESRAAKEPPGTNATGLAASASLPSLRGLHVLLVEDDPDVREVLVVALEGCGARVTALASVPEALDAFARSKPDLLITDIGLPEEDGYDLLRKVRTLVAEPGPLVPAVALTGYAAREDKRRAMAAGFQAYFAKPVDPLQLATAVAALMGR